jgi:hypothetical protein
MTWLPAILLAAAVIAAISLIGVRIEAWIYRRAGLPWAQKKPR